MNDAIAIGRGMVGKATMHVFGIEDFIDLKERTLDYPKAAEKRYHFICLPTPCKETTGECDTSEIRKYIKHIVSFGRANVFIIRSTIKPGTCKSIMEEIQQPTVVHVPEFLSEDTWKQDVEWPDITVIGGDDRNIRQDVEMMYKARYKGTEFFITNTVTAETIKYAINCFYSTKVVYANMIYDYAHAVGANYEVIKDAMYARKWIGKNHLNAWYEGKRGVRGKCLSKDLRALLYHSGSKLLKVVQELNEHYLRQK